MSLRRMLVGTDGGSEMAQSDARSAGHGDGRSRDGRRTARHGPDWLTALLQNTVGDGRIGLRSHIDLNLGGPDEPSLDPLLFKLLGVAAECRLLMGVSWISSGDLEACHAEWGEPSHLVDLRRGTDSPLSWEIWGMPAAALLRESVAGGSLVLAEQDPSWILYTDPAASSPMLFTSSRRCPRHG